MIEHLNAPDPKGLSALGPGDFGVQRKPKFELSCRRMFSKIDVHNLKKCSQIVDTENTWRL